MYEICLKFELGRKIVKFSNKRGKFVEKKSEFYNQKREMNEIKVTFPSAQNLDLLSTNFIRFHWRKSFRLQMSFTFGKFREKIVSNGG